MYADPTSFDSAMSEAELACFHRLVDYTATRPGVSAFVGRAGATLNSWTFRFTTPIPAPGGFHNYHTEVESLAWLARADLRYEKREDAQHAVMAMIRGLPMTYTGNVVQFAIDEIGDIVPTTYQPPNEDRRINVFEGTVTFSCVFKTGRREMPCAVDLP